MPDFTEDSLVEQPAIALFAELGWETANCYEETFGPDGTLDRETSSEVILRSMLLPALQRLNPELPAEALELAIQELERERWLMSPAHANREVYELLKQGVRVAFRDQAGAERVELARVIDWENAANNHFFLASQFWITGELHKRRPDLVGFVNGLPLLLVELKAPQVNVKHAGPPPRVWVKHPFNPLP